MIENKKYFIDRINSSKANAMTALYHYSGSGFRKAILNLGIFRKEDNKAVGILQFGCSFQDKILLNRYVKEDIKKEEYLELNRFCMADSEGKNSESQAISLGIKWIKKNMPNIRLLVSYAGRKEGNYGYIYQATNWEYLGYFISRGFYLLDGQERHLASIWHTYKKHLNNDLPFLESLCEHYQDVRGTFTKQFIYIMRLDKKLTPASEILPYPKPATEYPIKTKEVIYKQNDEIFNSFQGKERKYVEFFYEKDEILFKKSTLKRRGEIFPEKRIAMYDAGGDLELSNQTTKTLKELGYFSDGIRRSITTEKPYKNKYFKYYYYEPEEKIDVQFLCIIDEIPFLSFAEAGRYLGTSKQAVFASAKRKSKKIMGKDIIWV